MNQPLRHLQHPQRGGLLLSAWRHKTGTFRRAGVAGSIRISLLWCLAISGIIVVAYAWLNVENTTAVGHGSIQLSGIQLDRAAGELRLQADARIRLSRTVQAGLDSGVPLTFVLNLNVKDMHRYWPDTMIFKAERRYTLTYYELTRHYRVSELESDASRSFRSLTSALEGLGQLGRMSFVLDEQQEADLSQDGLTASLEMRLSTSELPLPLQPIIRSSWTLVSEEYRWPVT